jgi:hypothetical protein
MTILDIENKNTALLLALTDTVNKLTTAVANLPVPSGATPPDNSALLAAIQSLDGKISDVQAQLETTTPAAPAAS